jgi:choline dehydrogenase-like flavoprotein
VQARREVILSSGAFGSPQLLMLSGIGDENELQEFGIPVVQHLPGVGKNLQDHLDYVQAWRAPNDTATFGISLRGTAKVAAAMLEWRNKRSGMISSAYATAGAFIRSSSEVEIPDLQLIFVIAIVDDHARKLHLGHGFSCHCDLLHPFSRGSVELRSSDPRDAPLIDPGFLSDERDIQLLLKGGRIQQRIIESEPFAAIRGKMLYPVRIDDAAAIGARHP